MAAGRCCSLLDLLFWMAAVGVWLLQEPDQPEPGQFTCLLFCGEYFGESESDPVDAVLAL